MKYHIFTDPDNRITVDDEQEHTADECVSLIDGVIITEENVDDLLGSEEEALTYDEWKQHHLSLYVEIPKGQRKYLYEQWRIMAEGAPETYIAMLVDEINTKGLAEPDADLSQFQERVRLFNPDFTTSVA